MAYCLDQAVGHFGRALESELEQAGSDAKNNEEASWKRRLVLDRFIGEDKKPQRGNFADPAAMF